VVHQTADEVVVRVLDDSPLDGRGDGERSIALEGTQRGSLAAQRAGAGLGLHVASRLATAMGGRTWAGSREGKGSEFGFALPRTA
jgi:signal transduction histidine kinase